MRKKKFKLPPVGMRIIKSSIAVVLSFLIFALRGGNGIPFYSALSALWCMQTYSSDSKQKAIQRTIGTIIGAAYGLLLLLFEIYVLKLSPEQSLWGYILSGLMIIPIIYTTVLIKKKNASYFSCVVFLSITVTHLTDANPFFFVCDRVIDTMIGIIISLFVNTFHLPRKKRLYTLFVSELDNTLLTDNKLTTYSVFEINRMIDDGAVFTISTMLTPASSIDTLHALRIKLPIIAMNGSVLYDMNENSYVKIHSLPASKVFSVLSFLDKYDVCVFTNIIRDDRHTICYNNFKNETQEKIFKSLKKSPYRTYIRREPTEDDNVVYLMIIDEDSKMQKLYHELYINGFSEICKIMIYPSQDFPGNTYIKIYDKTVSKQEMIEHLKDISGTKEVITFGTKSDNTIVVSSNDANTTTKLLKQTFEPLRWKLHNHTNHNK